MTGEGKGESFAELFSRGDVPIAKRRTLSLGEEVEGVVVHVGKDAVFLELDGNQQAYFDVVDIRDASGEIGLRLGDRARGFVLSTEGGQVRLGRRLGREGASTEHLHAAFEGGVPVEGKITGANKGGVEVDLGGARGFCPFSQLDARRVDDPTAWIGRTLAFVITKLGDRDLVVSRRALLEREARAAREAVLGALEVGQIVRGRVSSIRDFGVFVDLGGVEGLVPLRELSHDRVRAADAVSLGDVIEAEVRAIEKKNDKTEITLSVRALAADPWEGIEAIAPVGRVVAGQVSRTAEFGAFVRLAAGVEGLLHVSELGARVRTAADAVEVGQSLLVRVLSVDTQRKRIGLALASEGASVGAEDAGARVIVGSIVEGVVEKVESWGVVVQLVGTKGRGGRASLPNAETATRPGADLRKEFPIGKKVTAKVLEASDSRVRISVKAAGEDAERAEFDGYRQRRALEGGMGTLGDLLKKKLEG